MLIKNASELTSKGNAGGRKVILKIVEETLEKVNYFIILKELVHLEKNILKIRDFELNLDKFRNIYLIGGGKNSSFMTSAIDEILRDRLTEGIVIEKKGCLNKKTKIAYSTGGHPLPDLDSVKSAHKIAKMVQKAKQEDLIIVCVSGGWTALTSNPEGGITLKELQKTYGLLLKSGMTVEQMNIVRNRLIQLGKGKILSMADGATIVGLIAVDEVEGKPWGPTVFDSSAPSDGIKILQDFNLFEKIPLSVKEYLVKEELKKKTTRETGFQHNGQSPYNFVIADNSLLCKAAQDTASKFGIKSFLLSTSIRGEAKDVGRVIASISKEISRFRRPFEPPCIIVAGGETTVTIVGKSGKGEETKRWHFRQPKILKAYRILS